MNKEIIERDGMKHICKYCPFKTNNIYAWINHMNANHGYHIATE